MKNNIIKILMVIVVLLLSVIILMSGYHSVDMAHNIKWLNAEYNINLYDYSLFGKEIGYLEMYNNGWQQIFYSFILLFFSSITLSLLLSKEI